VNYLDTSAVVRSFIAGKGSDRIAEMVRRGEPVATSKIGHAEVHAALARRRREGALSSRRYARACRIFEAEWKAYVRVDLRDEILELARDLIRRRPLRGFDAIHLASALMLGRELGEPMTFVAADIRLLGAAEAENLDVMNPEA
jgi:predicted nucleic acid-binding protein